MDNILLIVIAVVIIFAIIIFLAQMKQLKMTKNTVLCFTGGLGSGKTYMAVRMAIKEYKKANLKYKIGKLLNIKRLKAIKPTMISNIPIRIQGKKWAEVLTAEHVLLKADIPEGAIVVIDEIGQFASQYDYDNPHVMDKVQEFTRFFRHYFNGRLIMTDQSSSNIVVPIRRRINIIYCLNDFRRYFKFLPFFKCDVSPLEVTEEQVQNTISMQSQQKHFITSTNLRKPYFFGFLPYKWQKSKHYDSRCYSIRYDHNDKDKTVEYWESPKTAYVIDITATEEERKRYKALGRHWNDIGYVDEWLKSLERKEKFRTKR